jgi:HD-GYP domain-containing protein (c-di-GMP phosphodiesterase class II)
MEQIPMGARIMAVADAFDAMIHDRPYKKTLTFEDAILELKKHSGTQFDPQVVKAFIGLTKQKKFRNYLRETRKR